MDEGEKATIQEAARVLGISEGAVRKRVDRGTLQSEKGEDGRVYVRLPDWVDKPNSNVEVQAYEALVDDLRGQVEYLREELRTERQRYAEESRENRRIIAGLVQRVPELEAPREPSEIPPSAGEGHTPTEVQEDAQSDAEGRERGFWRRLFGG